MKRLLLLLGSIGLILTAVKAQGQEWALIPQEMEKSFELLVERQSIKQLPDGIVHARVRYEYKKSYGRPYDCRKCSPVKGVSHAVITAEFDCKARKMRIRELTEYYVDISPHSEPGEETWKQPVPKSIDEILINYVCTLTKNKE
jgi:hypothetical protein